MNQLDWVGGTEARQERAARAVRNQRESVAREKAMLSLRLHELLKKPPPGIANGSVNATRNWLAARAEAMKVAQSAKASAPELLRAIERMETFK